MLKKGFIQVYTGSGKGKTTAAIGLTVRAVGAGLQVYFCQFLKGQTCSEIKYLQSQRHQITFKKSGGTSFVKKVQPIDFELANECFQAAKAAMLSGKYDVVILDEIFAVVSTNLLNIKEIENFIKLKPHNVEVILTGRNAPKSIVKIADLVTEMKEIKHYFNKGVQARKGIEK